MLGVQGLRNAGSGKTQACFLTRALLRPQTFVLQGELILRDGHRRQGSNHQKGPD